MAINNPDNPNPPVITSEHGTTTEWARRQAAINMRNDPAVKARVVALIGEAKAREQYPEAFEDQDETQA